MFVFVVYSITKVKMTDYLLHFYLGVGAVGMCTSLVLFPAGHTNAYYPNAGFGNLAKFGVQAGVIGILSLTIFFVGKSLEDLKSALPANLWLIAATILILIYRKALLRLLQNIHT